MEVRRFSFSLNFVVCITAFISGLWTPSVGQYLGGDDDGFSLAQSSSQSLAYEYPIYVGSLDDGYSSSGATFQSLAYPVPI